ncbi:serine/threonine-protein kinase [Actinomadura spongiicola]|uniref:serine/threonine-protein kinase n=1 Tax=Actinomadura spongiicola TaxID=2303421 RepID=UPI0018F1B011|nr:serine/threonine-protein kinase [Actinomadura spongiicola]
MGPLQDGDPRRVGAYTLSARLGGGGMGQVFLGRSPGGRPVAVKLVRPEYGDDPQFRRRFATEIEAARRVGGFFTAQLVDADPHAERPWLVTAYVPGPSLQSAVDEQGPLPVGAVRVLGAGLAEGLMAVHACGLVHRDLKPGNVILAPDGPRVIDFGIVRALEATSGTATGAITGTVAYMSPEQARTDKEIGPAADVFAFGSVLVFASTGAAPFGRGQAHTVLYRIVREDPDLDAVPAGLRDLVAACLAKEPADRPALREVLERCAGGAGDDWPPPGVRAMAAAMPAAMPPALPPALPPAQPGTAPAAPPPVPPAVPSVGSTAVDPTTPPSARRSGGGGRSPARWILGGVAGVVAVAALVAAAVLVALNWDDLRAPSTDGASPPGRAKAVSTVTGRIQDAAAGFSYARFGSPWVTAGGAWKKPGMFTSGQIAPLPKRNGDSTFNATSLAGVPRAAESSGYTGPRDLAAVAARVRTRVIGELFTVQHTETTLRSGLVDVNGGGKGWLEKVRFDFPQAKANGWPVTGDTMALLVVDQDGADGGRPGLLLLSAPDTFAHPGDLDLVIGSVRVL